MKRFHRTGTLILAAHLLACGGTSEKGTSDPDRTSPGQNDTIEHLGDAPRTDPTRNVIINDVRLTDAEIRDIELKYRVQIVDANYWYDPMTGAWGLKDGPTRGFVLPGLQLGGPLKADASGRVPTDVYVNGRQLHPLDVSGLSRCVNVLPGNYYVGADGIGGRVGEPPTFNLYALCGGGRAGGGGGGGWLCDGGSCGTDRTVTGATGVGLEGGGQAGVYTGSGLILTPN